MTEHESRAHADRFNAAVTSGDWSVFLAGFTADVVMTFVGPPVGPFVGIEQITRAYVGNPPDDTMDILSVRADADADVVRFQWSQGGTGTMTIHRRDGLISSLAVVFDR
jgi:hypothetical protein